MHMCLCIRTRAHTYSSNLLVTTFPAKILDKDKWYENVVIEQFWLNSDIEDIIFLYFFFSVMP